MKIAITVNGKELPCRPTMGAMLRFKRETGKEVTEIADGNFSDLCAYLYCCVASACAADGVPFDMSLLDFADALSPDDMNAWVASIQSDVADGATDEEKKS